MNASDGVFYRLGIGTFGYSNGAERLGDRYTGGLTLYAPLSRRLEVQFDVPFVDSFDGHTDFGDLPKLLPASFYPKPRRPPNPLTWPFAFPPAIKITANRSAVLTPNYQFWTNHWKGLVLRGGLGMAIPVHNQRDTGARTAIVETLPQAIISPSMTPHPSAILSRMSPPITARQWMIGMIPRLPLSALPPVSGPIWEITGICSAGLRFRPPSPRHMIIKY